MAKSKSTLERDFFTKGDREKLLDVKKWSGEQDDEDRISKHDPQKKVRDKHEGAAPIIKDEPTRRSRTFDLDIYPDSALTEEDILDKIDKEKQHKIDRNLQGDKKIKPGVSVRMKDNKKIYYKVIDVNLENSEVILKHPGTGKEKRVDISVLDPRTVSGVLKAA